MIPAISLLAALQVVIMAICGANSDHNVHDNSQRSVNTPGMGNYGGCWRWQNFVSGGAILLNMNISILIITCRLWVIYVREDTYSNV